MRATTVPSHAIVGVGGNAAFRELGSLALPFLPVLDTGASFLFTASTTLLGLDAFFFGSFRHDLIVSEESQRGSLTGNAVTTFEAAEDAANCAIDISYGLTCSLAIHMIVTKEARIGARVIDLLNEPVHSESFGYF